MTIDTENPFVSIIIPVYNDPEGIRSCLTALQSQAYPETQFEVLVVDNGSTDGTRDVIRDFSVQLLVEDEVQGSYAARNKGIEASDGDVLAFVDADCTPEPEWVAAGVETMSQEDADLVAGRVRFEFTPDRTPAERFDAMGNMRNDKTVPEGVGKTANLFVRKTVVNEIGTFPQNLRSGGDVYWTRAATNAGMKIAYSPDAIVNHPSRQFQPLLKKMYRVGNGSAEIWYLDDQTTVWTILAGLARFPLKALRFMFTEVNNEPEKKTETPPDRDVEQSIGVHLVATLAVGALLIGRVVGLIRLLPRVISK
ncbi:glycosyltransferase AglE [Natrialba hulunbeirensis JCM 10989]|uniref:Glycosyltransferase AglE n=1 Tax=Natrialba hulunbeirensis JCM 10989 TaxID=1227493 RepID=M0AA85_9EURY|nr:glycosyltransferase [Natrialba hulunbeirensis]ELY95665.1 glycosyltransferase AglE [Natrialba hulunbeirensis JCM 10989]